MSPNLWAPFFLVLLVGCQPRKIRSLNDAPVTVTAYTMNLDQADSPSCELPFEGTVRCPGLSESGVPLDSAQQTRFFEILTDQRAFAASGSECFVPHHAFVVRDSSDEIVQQVAVCFLCENLLATPALPSQPVNQARPSLSAEAVGAFRSLCRALDLPRCDASPP